MTRKWYVTGLMLVVVAALAFSLTGCKKAADELAETVAEGIVEGTTGVDVDTDDGTVTYETEDGATVEIAGEASDIPDGFPGDFPVYKADIESSSKISSGEGTGFYVGLVTEDSYDEVFEWYKEELADEGWEILAEMTTGTAGEKSGILTISKGTSEGGVTFAEDGEVTRIAISINTK